MWQNVCNLRFKKNTMKLFTFLLFVFFITAFSSCENHMDIRDEAHGTPSRADTVLPHRYAPVHEATTEKTEDVPAVYRR